MKRNTNNLGYYQEGVSRVGQYDVEEISNPLTRDKQINQRVVKDIQQLLLNIYAKGQTHREQLQLSTFCNANVHKSSMDSDHLWLIFNKGGLCAYASGRYIYTASAEQVYVFKACMISAEIENRAELYSWLYARQIIRGVLCYWNNSQNIGRPLPFITRTLNPVVAQTLYQIGSNMYPGLDGSSINDTVRSRYRAFEAVINEAIQDDGILVNSFMKHSDYSLKQTKGKSLRSKIHNLCRTLGDSDGVAITGEINFEQWLIDHLYDKSAIDQTNLKDINLIQLLQSSAVEKVSQISKLEVEEGGDYV